MGRDEGALYPNRIMHHLAHQKATKVAS
jgi:hypothetical protein